MEPVAWRRPDANARPGFWLYYGLEPRGFKDAQPLYTQDQLDAAVQAERDRCARIAEEREERTNGARNELEAGENIAAMNIAAAIREGE